MDMANASQKQTEQKVSEGATIDLAQGPVATLIDAGHAYTFYFNRITEADWERYFSGVIYTSHNEGKASVQILDMDSPGIDLAESKLDRVEGYRGQFMSKPGWQKIMPPRHMRPVSWLIRAVNAMEENDEQAFDPECIECKLEALWGMEKPGAMMQYSGLTHRFNHVSPEQKHRFYRAGATSKIVGGSRNGKTVHSVRYKVLLRIYDELIISVDGYCLNGKPLESPDEIRREMDAYHKVKAVEQLFTGSQAPTEADGEQAA